MRMNCWKLRDKRIHEKQKKKTERSKRPAFTGGLLDCCPLRRPNTRVKEKQSIVPVSFSFFWSVAYSHGSNGLLCSSAAHLSSNPPPCCLKYFGFSPSLHPSSSLMTELLAGDMKAAFSRLKTTLNSRETASCSIGLSTYLCSNSSNVPPQSSCPFSHFPHLSLLLSSDYCRHSWPDVLFIKKLILACWCHPPLWWSCCLLTTASQYAFNISLFHMAAQRNQPSLVWEDFTQQSVKAAAKPSQRIKLLSVSTDSL